MLVEFAFRWGLILCALLALGFATPTSVLGHPLLWAPIVLQAASDARRPCVCWQLLPTYAGWLVALAGGWWRAGAALGLSGAAAAALIPVTAIEGLLEGGRYSVGVLDYEVVAASNGAAHPAIGRLFYPSAEKHSSTTGYIALGNRHGLTRHFMAVAAPVQLQPYLPAWLLSHWAAAPMPAKVNAAPHAPADGDPPLPVVVFSHGLTAARETSR